MTKEYKYGNEVRRSMLTIVKPEDRKRLQAFYCGHEVLDNYISNEIFEKYEQQGLHFIITNLKNDDVIGFVSLATSGIIHKVDNYLHNCPAIKIDVFAIDCKYQKMHISEESEKSEDHFYLSDLILADVIQHCREIDEKYALIDYIILYADKRAERFYIRNQFMHYEQFMEKENYMELTDTIPMYMDL